MELTIIERDPLHGQQYENFISTVELTERKENQQTIFIVGVIIFSLLILWIVLERYSEKNTL